MIGEMMVCPNCGRIASHDSYFSAMVCRQCGWIKYDSPTNADRLRSMSDEELVKFLQEPFCDRRTGKECKETFCGDCDAYMLDWLRQPAEEASDGQTI